MGCDELHFCLLGRQLWQKQRRPGPILVPEPIRHTSSRFRLRFLMDLLNTKQDSRYLKLVWCFEMTPNQSLSTFYISAIVVVHVSLIH